MTAPPPLPRVALGHTDQTIPRVALGCGNFGGVGSSPAFFGQGLTDDQAAAVMDRAWELGISHFDTADAYGGGRSERSIGRWIAARGVRPTLTTKTFNPVEDGGDHGLAPERVQRRLQQSLERLSVDSVELFLAHDYDPEVPLADTFAAFESLRDAGALLAYGVSNFDAGQLASALDGGSPAAVQNSYSLLDQGDRRRMLALCEARGLSYLAFSPLAGGWLTGKYRRGEAYPEGSRMSTRPEPYQRLTGARTFEALERLESFAAEQGMSMAGASLAWLLSEPRVAQIVVGPGRPEHLEPVREALAHPLAPNDFDRLGSMLA